MSTSNNNRSNHPLLALFRRGEQWREIPAGSHYGDVRSDIPIAILPEAKVMGNVFAPKILVEGMLYGSAVALEITIEAEGQIWGDTYCGRLQVEPGGRLQGWVSELDASVYEAVHADGLIPEELQDHTIDLSELPDEAVESGLFVRGEQQLNVLHRLQMESAAALAARDELEREFEKRLNETAGEATARAASLHEELSKLRLELTNLREDRDELREELRERTAQVERQANEIITARDLLNGRTEQYEDLQQEHTTKLEEFADLLQTKNGLEHDLLAANKQIDTLSDRLRSIESALQNSLQHASEQEESLIRWQELAEVTEAKVQTLQSEIDNLNFQVSENGRLTEMLRAQRKHAEDAWQEAAQELEELRRRETESLVRPEELAALQEQIGQLEEKLAQAEAQNNQQKVQTDKLKAQLSHIDESHEAELAQLREEAKKAKQEVRRSQELGLWDKATLEKTEIALAAAQAKLEAQQADYERLKAELAEKQKAATDIEGQLAEWTATEGKLTKTIEDRENALAQAQNKLMGQESELKQLKSTLEEREAAVDQLQQEVANLNSSTLEISEERDSSKKQLAQIQEQAVLKNSELRDRLRETRLQLEAQEAESENYLQQMEQQGQRLAEMQATLIERVIELKQVQATADKQKALINRIKDVTSEKMNKLNDELAQTREQLKQAVAMVRKLRDNK
jgi:chromosome segregation ATPase